MIFKLNPALNQQINFLKIHCCCPTPIITSFNILCFTAALNLPARFIICIFTHVYFDKKFSFISLNTKYESLWQ